MITQGTDGVYVRLHVQPGAKRPGIVGIHGDSLKVAVTAPPEKGKANLEVVATLATALGVRNSQVDVVAGHTSRRKRVLIRGVDLDDVRALLAF